METVCDVDGFICPLRSLAQRLAVDPAGAILPVALEARCVLALATRGAGAAVGVALAIFQRKALQVDVRRRVRITLRLGRCWRSVGGWSRTDRRATGREHYQGHETVA